MFEQYHSIHFIGIGGSGISALAQLALAQGIRVTGSDITESNFSRLLQGKGALVSLKHHQDNVFKTTDLVVYSEAIDLPGRQAGKATNPEYLAARERDIPVMSYFEALGEFSKTKKTIVVTGTHGKTTTTAMLGEALIAAGMDPTVVVGTQVPSFENSNLYIGRSEWFVVEGCEYRRSFLNFHPFGVVMLNCEAEHLDYYKDEEDYRSAFRELMMKIPPEGFLVVNGHDDNLTKITKDFTGNLVRVTEKLDMKLAIPGEFNQWNAAHAHAAAQQMGADLAKVKQALENYRGSARRMEVKGEVNGVTVIDDYGHHPTEVRETLRALKERYPGRQLICVFQPHQYSRTYQLLDQFREAFGAADQVIIPNIYEARDSAEDKARMSAKKLVEELGKTHSNVQWGRDFETTAKLIQKIARPGDVVVVMGAGDVGKLAERLTHGL